MTQPAPEGPASEGTDPEGPAATGLLDRLKSMERRTWLLIATGVLLAILFIFFDGCRGVEVTETEAVAAARAALEESPQGFEPERTDAKFLRQGFPPRPRWAVVFTIADPEGDFDDFLRTAAVLIDGVTGRVLELSIDGSDSG